MPSIPSQPPFLTCRPIVCDLCCAVHDVSQDLRGHDDDIGISVQRRVPRLQPTPTMTKAPTDLSQLLIAQRLFMRKCREPWMGHEGHMDAKERADQGI